MPPAVADCPPVLREPESRSGIASEPLGRWKLGEIVPYAEHAFAALGRGGGDMPKKVVRDAGRGSSMISVSLHWPDPPTTMARSAREARSPAASERHSGPKYWGRTKKTTARWPRRGRLAVRLGAGCGSEPASRNPGRCRAASGSSRLDSVARTTIISAPNDAATANHTAARRRREGAPRDAPTARRRPG